MQNWTFTSEARIHAKVIQEDHFSNSLVNCQLLINIAKLMQRALQRCERKKHSERKKRSERKKLGERKKHR